MENFDYYANKFEIFRKKVLSEYHYPCAKPLIFIPCSSVKQSKRGQIGYSHSPSHQFLSLITRDSAYEKIVISDVLGYVPYVFESQIPLYEFPPEALISDLRISHIKNQLLHLTKIHEENPNRTTLFFIGSAFYADLFEEANQKLAIPFSIEKFISPTGLMGYSAQARLLKKRLDPNFDVLKQTQMKAFF